MNKQQTRIKRLTVFIFLFVAFITGTGCIAQGKYKKHKVVPCPCEKQNKR